MRRIMTKAKTVYMQKDKLVFLASCDRHTLGHNSLSGLFCIKKSGPQGDFNTYLQFKHLHQLKEYQTALRDYGFDGFKYNSSCSL